MFVGMSNATFEGSQEWMGFRCLSSSGLQVAEGSSPMSGAMGLTQSTSVNVSLLQTPSQKHPGCCPTKYRGPDKLTGKVAIVQEVQTSDS